MKKLVIDDTKFKGLVAGLCRDIANSNWRPDYIVGITRGGLVAATMISHYFNLRMETLNVSLRDGDHCESNLWMAEDAFGFDSDASGGERSKPRLRKNILIVDDINDTGATLDWIMKDWPSGCLPDDPAWNEIWGDNVRFAVVVNNNSSRCTTEMDYVGMRINKAEEDVWVDFPYENWWA